MNINWMPNWTEWARIGRIVVGGATAVSVTLGQIGAIVPNTAFDTIGVICVLIATIGKDLSQAAQAQIDKKGK